MGYQIIEAGSGTAALTLLSERPDIDLLLVDYAMPGMSGVETATRARAMRPNLPCMYVTGYADLAALREVGGQSVVQKPFAGDELARKVQAVLGARQESRTWSHWPPAGAAIRAASMGVAELLGPGSADITRRFRLRNATRAEHARLDALITGAGFLTTRSRYLNYLAATLAAREAVERALDAAGAEKAFPDWPRRRIAMDLRRDLQDLGHTASVSGASGFEVSSHAEILGALYVLEGASLGARLLQTAAATLAWTPDLARDTWRRRPPTGRYGQGLRRSSTRRSSIELVRRNAPGWPRTSSSGSNNRIGTFWSERNGDARMGCRAAKPNGVRRGCRQMGAFGQGRWVGRKRS
jgi:heme oxygenase/CheY-like chemotaxis protein